MPRLAVLLAALWAVAALTVQYRRARAFGPRRLFAAPAGDPAAGVRYAFIQGMAPWAKESVLLNLPSYAAGMLFHAGVLAAFALLAAAVLGARAPLAARAAAATLALAGGASGLALLGKRLLKPHLRGLSVPDDYVSNLLASVFALLAGAQALAPALASAWLAEAALLLFYAPLGKIRHCLFFFPARRHFGAFFGRRGVLPPGDGHHA
jgi:hypothetical protein